MQKKKKKKRTISPTGNRTQVLSALLRSRPVTGTNNNHYTIGEYVRLENNVAELHVVILFMDKNIFGFFFLHYFMTFLDFSSSARTNA